MQVITKGPVTETERESAVAFLRAAGYLQPIHAGDEVFAAWAGFEVIGAVRLANEHGILVLRGMRVREDLRRRGVGRQLLHRIDETIGETTCWCIPYASLTAFYGTIGFKVADVVDAPAFLADRCRRYVQQGLNVAIMVRQ